MAIHWQKTDLSIPVTRPDGRQSYAYEVGASDRETIPFPAGEALIGITADLTVLDSGESADALIAAATLGMTEIGNDTALVTVAGLTRGVVYELAVTFENAAGRKWSQTLVIPCVA